MSKKKKINKNKKLLLIVSILCVCGVGFMWFQNNNSSRVEYYVTDREQRTISVGQNTLHVEVVITPQSLSQGLSGRDKIGSDGMLFLFNKKRVVTFWMKEMKFDLDIIWISDNQVKGIAKNVPKPSPGASLNELPTYSSEVPVTAVLEVPAGTTEKLGIKTGDNVTLPVLAP